MLLKRIFYIFIFISAVFLLNPALVYSEKIYTYQTSKKDVNIGKAWLVFENFMPAQKKVVRWVQEKDEGRREEAYFYDEDSNIVSWKVSANNEKTDYEAHVRGFSLHIKGILRGRHIDKKLEINGLPLYANPKVDLWKILSDRVNAHDFWAIRNDSLSKVKMTAIYQGIELIPLKGEIVRAHKIYWKSKLFPESVFNRTYWFRESDGLFLRQTGSDQKRRTLIKEVNR